LRAQNPAAASAHASTWAAAAMETAASFSSLLKAVGLKLKFAPESEAA
jgi:hypothetical protein